MQIHLMNPPSSRGAKDPDLCGSSAAALHRSPAGSPDDIDNVIMEKIASGSLDKMIRLAFSDPDQELWRYRIIVGSREYDGNDIIEMAGSIDLSIDAATAEWLQSAVSVWQTEENVGDDGFSEPSDT